MYKIFDEVYKRKFHFEIENIKMAISAFQGHAALALIVYPEKINDIEILNKVIICPLRKHMDLIQSLIRSFRSKALQKGIQAET